MTRFPRSAMTANTEYFTARRLQERQARREEGKAREPRARRAPLNQLPWDLAQDEFGPQGADFLEEFGRLLLVSWQDALAA